MKNTKITVPTPCHEKWSEMTPTEKGRFCSACQKNVRDFTLSSDREIASYLSENTNVCGRFRDDQLNREIFVSQDKSKFWTFAASGILGILSTAIQAQEQPKSQSEKMVGQKLGEVESAEKTTAAKDSVLKTNGKKIVSGIVSDHLEALPGANVIVEETKNTTQTDIDGKYEIEVEQGQTLVFFFIGMEELRIKVGQQNKYDVIMKESANISSGVVVTSIVRPDIFKRTYYRVRNWFRKD